MDLTELECLLDPLISWMLLEEIKEVILLTRDPL